MFERNRLPLVSGQAIRQSVPQVPATPRAIIGSTLSFVQASTMMGANPLPIVPANERKHKAADLIVEGYISAKCT